MGECRSQRMARTILIISHDFPPALAGVRRIVKFAKYLPEFGYEPVVVCAAHDPAKPVDHETLAQVEAQGYPVVRTRSIDPYRLLRRGAGSGAPKTASASSGSRGIFSRMARAVAPWVFVPDEYVGWVPFATSAAADLIRSGRIDCILTTSYPNSAHLPGLRLSSRFGVKWVADFRDGWTQNPYFGRMPTPLHASLSAGLERRVARRADALVTVSQPIARHLGEISGSPQKVHVIANGFDRSDYEGIEPLQFDRYTVAYTGTLFMHRTPEAFFRALKQVTQSMPGRVQVVFRTQFKPEHEQLIAQYGLSDVVRNLGMGSYRESLQLQMSADALLVLEAEAPNSEIMLTQKIFEYMAAGKLVLALAPEGALADVVRNTGIGRVVSPDDADAAAVAIQELVSGQAIFQRDEKLIASYDRRELTRSLAQVLDSVLA